jgi:hypothetical protein
MTTTNPTDPGAAEAAGPAECDAAEGGAAEGSQLRLFEPPEPTHIGRCCGVPLLDRRWGLWTCPECRRAYTYPYNPGETS